MDIVSIVIGLLVGAAVGVGIAIAMIKKSNEKKANAIIEEAKAESEVIKKDKILQAKEKFLSLKEEHEKVIASRERKVVDAENRVKQKETSLNNKLHENNKKDKDLKALKGTLDKKLEVVDSRQTELDKNLRKQVEMLEKTAGLSAEEAKAQMVEVLKEEAKTDAMAHIKDTIEEAKINANMEARKVVIQSIQRVATEQAIENSVSIFNIESDDMKGRIIGREGRNIRALEAATGVEVIVDDTPEAIILSCFDPVRRKQQDLHCISWFQMEGFILLELKK